MEYSVLLNSVQVIVTADDSVDAEFKARALADQIAMDYQVEMVETY